MCRFSFLPYVCLSSVSTVSVRFLFRRRSQGRRHRRRGDGGRLRHGMDAHPQGVLPLFLPGPKGLGGGPRGVPERGRRAAVRQLRHRTGQCLSSAFFLLRWDYYVSTNTGIGGGNAKYETGGMKELRLSCLRRGTGGGRDQSVNQSIKSLLPRVK